MWKKDVDSAQTYYSISIFDGSRERRQRICSIHIFCQVVAQCICHSHNQHHDSNSTPSALRIKKKTNEYTHINKEDIHKKERLNNPPIPPKKQKQTTTKKKERNTKLQADLLNFNYNPCTNDTSTKHIQKGNTLRMHIYR